MRRFVQHQTDLFSPPPAREVVVVQEEPLVALWGLLGWLRGLERLPWADAAGAMAVEQRALGLAGRAGAEGAALAAAIMEETERLLSLADRAAVGRV